MRQLEVALSAVVRRSIAGRGPVSVYHFADVLSEELRADDYIVSGSSGSAIELFLLAFRVKNGQRVFHTTALGAMGFGIAASIGAVSPAAAAVPSAWTATADFNSTFRSSRPSPACSSPSNSSCSTTTATLPFAPRKPTSSASRASAAIDDRPDAAGHLAVARAYGLRPKSSGSVEPPLRSAPGIEPSRAGGLRCPCHPG